jgi:hypothetical protein
MTRYSRSVLPGRTADEPENTDGLDRLVFGGKRRAANDPDEPDFLPPLDDDNDRLVARANSDRRKGSQERRVVTAPSDRRNPTGRRASEYTPLRDDGARRSAPEDSKRGPLLLVGALLIVVVFAVVVWNAYRDGLQGDEVEVAPELSTAGSFKTPPRAVEPAPIVAEPTQTAAETSLDGGPPAIEASDERRPISLTPAEPVEQAAVTPAPSKVTAPPPPTLKAPVSPPVQVVAVPPAQQPTAKSSAVAAKPVVIVAVTPAPAKPAPATTASGLTAYGDHVVQIAATSSEATANSEWVKLLKAYPDMLTGGQKFIQQADVNGKTVYRLRVGSFASKADAAAFCAAFKAKGGNCYPALK